MSYIVNKFFINGQDIGYFAEDYFSGSAQASSVTENYKFNDTDSFFSKYAGSNIPSLQIPSGYFYITDSNGNVVPANIAAIGSKVKPVQEFYLSGAGTFYINHDDVHMPGTYPSQFWNRNTVAILISAGGGGGAGASWDTEPGGGGGGSTALVVLNLASYMYKLVLGGGGSSGAGKGTGGSNGGDGGTTYLYAGPRESGESGTTTLLLTLNGGQGGRHGAYQSHQDASGGTASPVTSALDTYTLGYTYSTGGIGIGGGKSAGQTAGSCTTSGYVSPDKESASKITVTGAGGTVAWQDGTGGGSMGHGGDGQGGYGASGKTGYFVFHAASGDVTISGMGGGGGSAGGNKYFDGGSGGAGAAGGAVFYY